MTMNYQAKLLLAGASLLASAIATPAFAQEEEGSAIDALTADIVVTATKKKDVENVQAVPLAITAFSQGSLEAIKVRDLQSLSYSTPNVSLDQVGTSRGTANFSIRGLGVNSSIPSIDPTVGVFVDGVYMGVNNGLVFDMFDLGSVEIARGPQGILFGRNTTGGAVIINTGDPTPDFRGKVKASLDGPVDGGRGGANFSVSGVVSGPIVTDKLNFKFGAYFNNDGGYFKNLFDGSNHGKASTEIVRGALEFRPAETIRMVGKLEYFHSKGDGPSGQNHGIYKRDTFDFAIDNAGFYENETLFASHKTEIEIGDGKLTNIFGWRNYDASTGGDIDATARFLFHSNTRFKQEQFSDELRFNQRFGALDLTTGAFWFTQKLRYDELRFYPTFISPLTQYGGGAQDHDVLGLFASGDFDVTDALTLTAGIRWSKETKDADITYIRPRPACSIVDATCPQTGKNPIIPTENNGFSDKKTWESWSPKLGAQYKFSNRAQVYANWTRGFRSGGYNFRITNANAFELVAATRGFSFDEEQVDSYEIGAKFQTDDRKLTLNAALFRTDVGNMQREINQASTSGVSQSIYNTADAKIEGAEAEVRFAATSNLLFTANVGYVNARYKTVKFDLTGDNVVNAADLSLDLPRTPKWTYGAGVIADFPVGEGSVTGRLSWQHRDRYAYTDSNYGWITASDNLEANLAWKNGSGLTVSIYAKNLLDEVQHGGDTQLGTAAQIPIFGGPLSTGVDVPFGANPKAGSFSPLNKGRVLGIEVGYDF